MAPKSSATREAICVRAQIRIQELQGGVQGFTGLRVWGLGFRDLEFSEQFWDLGVGALTSTSKKEPHRKGPSCLNPDI